MSIVTKSLIQCAFQISEARAATQGLTDRSSFSLLEKLKAQGNSWILLPSPNFKTKLKKKGGIFLTTVNRAIN